VDTNVPALILGTIIATALLGLVGVAIVQIVRGVARRSQAQSDAIVALTVAATKVVESIEQHGRYLVELRTTVATVTHGLSECRAQIHEVAADLGKDSAARAKVFEDLAQFQPVIESANQLGKHSLVLHDLVKVCARQLAQLISTPGVQQYDVGRADNAYAIQRIQDQLGVSRDEARARLAENPALLEQIRFRDGL